MLRYHDARLTRDRFIVDTDTESRESFITREGSRGDTGDEVTYAECGVMRTGNISSGWSV